MHHPLTRLKRLVRSAMMIMLFRCKLRLAVQDTVVVKNVLVW